MIVALHTELSNFMLAIIELSLCSINLRKTHLYIVEFIRNELDAKYFCIALNSTGSMLAVIALTQRNAHRMINASVHYCVS